MANSPGTLLARLALGLLLSGVIAGVAYRREALCGSGALGAVITGSLIFGLGGWVWGLQLITFFVLSTLLSGYRARYKERLAEKFAKGGRRDLGQVLANGGAGVLLAVAFAFTGGPSWFFAFTGAMATVNADTWATELGVLARRQPRLITTGRVVEPGTSGGVSLLGLGATLAGGAAMGLTGLGYSWLDGLMGGVGPPRSAMLVAIAALAGLTGSLTDSLLGATVQAIYYTHGRRKETERAVDPDGSPNELLRGWRWLNNDWVNFLSSVVGAATAIGMYLVHSAARGVS